jgi:hypothetical protein
VNLAAGLFLFLFGAIGTWWSLTRFPHAHFTRASSVFMSISGIVFVIWIFTQTIGVGLAAFALLLFSGVSGAIGAIRKETRALPPG